MNYLHITPEERLKRARRRYRKERKRYRPKMNAKRKAKRRQAIYDSLVPLSFIPLWLDCLPNEKLFSPSFAVRRRCVQELNDMAQFSLWKSREPSPEFQGLLNRRDDIADPTLKIRAYRPWPMPAQLAVTDPKLLAKLYQGSGMHREYTEDGLIEHELNLDGDSYCGWCQQHALRVVLHAPEDATWHCWGCARIRTSLELIYERPHSTWEEVSGMFFACTERGRLIEAMQGWNTFLQRRLNDILSFGRFFYRDHAIKGRYPAAYGDWARLCLESVESIPGVGRISMTGLRRSYYLIRIMKTLDGRIGAIHLYGENYKPLFTHHFLVPGQPLIETPWWADQRPWDTMVVTHDRHKADIAERYLATLPLSERTPVALLPAGLDLETLPYDTIIYA